MPDPAHSRAGCSLSAQPRQAALYADGRTPIFLDKVEAAFDFADGPPLSVTAEVARVDYRRASAIIVFPFQAKEAIEALGPYTPVALDQLTLQERAPETTATLSPQMRQALETLHRVSAGGSAVDFSRLEAFLLAERAIHDYDAQARAADRAFVDSVNPEGKPVDYFPQQAAEARPAALTRLARLSDEEALSVIESNRLPECGDFPFITIEEVQKRRAHRHAIERMMERLHERHAKRPARIRFRPKQARLE